MSIPLLRFLRLSVLFALGAAGAVHTCVQAAAQTATLPAGAHRLLFLGDSITYSGEYITYLETYFLTRHPEQATEFVNLGLPSETVSGLSEEGHAGGQFPRPDLHERLARILTQAKPDLVFACYGMNDGIYLPFDLARFQKYKEGIGWLRDQVTAAGAKLILVTPPSFDGEKVNNLPYTATLNKYADWLLSKRDSAGWAVVDLHGPMNRYLAERRTTDPGFAYAGDGVHPNATGHWIIAKQILLYLGAHDLEGVESAEAMAASYPGGRKALDLVARRQALTKDAWLTAIKHLRPGMNQGVPLPEAQVGAEELEKEIRAALKGV